CILYEMATGRRAFPGNSAAEVLAALLRDQPADMDPSDGQCLGALEQLVTRCLAKQPENRIQSAGDVAVALKSLDTADAKTPGPTSAFPAPPCVAVLPLQNFSANRMETDYIVDGMTEVLTAELAKNRALRVASRTTMMRFKDSRD